MKKSRLPGAVCACICLLTYTSAHASLITDTYIRSGPSEQAVIPFVASNGIQTVNAYSGHVEVIVSGVGNSLSTATNDAFYGVYGDLVDCVSGGVPIKSTCLLPPTFQLAVASEQTSFEHTGASDVENFITFIESVGYVTPGTLPDYDPLHLYHFVLDLALLNVNGTNKLTFGVTDDFHSDNGGEYFMEIYQVQAIPIPASVWLFGSGLLSLIGLTRRRT